MGFLLHYLSIEFSSNYYFIVPKLFNKRHYFPQYFYFPHEGSIGGINYPIKPDQVIKDVLIYERGPCQHKKIITLYIYNTNI